MKRKKILVIGDSLDNDIKGANLQNLDSVLIHREDTQREVNNNNDIDKQKLDDLIKKKNFSNILYGKLKLKEHCQKKILKDWEDSASKELKEKALDKLFWETPEG